MKTIRKKYPFVCIITTAFLVCCAISSAQDYEQSDKRDISTPTQLTVVCSSEKPAVVPGETISVRAYVSSDNVKSMQYTWSATAGTIVGHGSEVRWDFSGVIPDKYHAYVQVKDSIGRSTTCSTQVVVWLPLTGRDPVKETVRSLLVRGKAEEDGYGLYSYLLFGSRPSDSTSRQRYCKAIEAYLNLINDIGIMEEYYENNELNITYLPVDSAPTTTISVDWVLEHYDYGRARALLNAIPGDLRNGPYFISTLEPLSGRTVLLGQYLYQNLSAVPADANLIPLWVKAFLNQAAQERFWEENRAEMFTLELRTTISILAEGLPEVRRALEDWIAWFN